jgi:long-chain acyl-CoA synthetase
MVRPTIYGQKNLTALNGPALFVSNHVTQVDPIFILAALPARMRNRLAIAMMGERLEEMRNPGSVKSWWRRWIHKIKYGMVTALFNVFPLPQKTGFRESFRFAGESVDRGYSILVFPEGGRTRDGNMVDFRSGIGMLAQNLNIPVVPMRIDGLYELKIKGKYFAHTGDVSVHIGPPVYYNPDRSPAEIAEDLKEKCAAL